MEGGGGLSRSGVTFRLTYSLEYVLPKTLLYDRTQTYKKNLESIKFSWKFWIGGATGTTNIKTQTFQKSTSMASQVEIQLSDLV